MSRRKVLIAHGYWGRGGAETATMQLIEAIKDEFEIFVLTRGGWHLNELNKVAHTAIDEAEIKLIKLPWAKLLGNTTGGALWHALFLRYCRHVANEYDICITASRTIGWGRPAIHFLSDVVWNDELSNLYDEGLSKDSLLQNILKTLGQSISGKARTVLHPEDIFVANSKWTSSVSAKYSTNIPVVIYPAVSSEFTPCQWENRKHEFISFGRISPEKRIEDSIHILEKVRAKGHNIGLTIFGEFDNSYYALTINELVANKPWIKTPGPIYGEQKKNLLSSYKFGINTCHREAFGISTAEMMKAGIIPFVPIQGAQNEIVNIESLVFDNIKDAVQKISAVLDSQTLQQSIIEHLNNQKFNFSSEEYKSKVLELLSNLKTK